MGTESRVRWSGCRVKKGLQNGYNREIVRNALREHILFFVLCFLCDIIRTGLCVLSARP